MDLPIPLWWLEFDQHMRTQKTLEEMRKQNTIGFGGASEADWEKARKLHAEKMRKKNG